MKKKLLILLIVLSFLVSAATPAFAGEVLDANSGISIDDLVGDTIKDLTKITESFEDSATGDPILDRDGNGSGSGGAVDPKEEYGYGPVAEYSDSDDMETKIAKTKSYYSFSVDTDWKLISLGAAVNGVSNIFFGIAKAWIGFCAKVTGWAVKFRAYDKLAQGYNNIMDKITKLTGDVFNRSDKGLSGLIWLGVVFAMCGVVLLFAQKRTVGAFGRLLSTILILVFISSYMILPNTFMNWAQSFATDVGTQMLSGNDGASDVSEEVMNKIWIMGVDQPWQDLEFGSIVDNAESGGALSRTNTSNDWLVISPKDRSKRGTWPADEESKETQMNDDTGVQAARAGEAFLVLLIDLVLGLLFLVLAAVVLGFQIGSIVMWAVGFFVLIVALFPTHGTNKIREWGATLALTYFGQIVVYVVLLLVTEVIGSFYTADSMIEVYGYMLGVIFGIYLMKKPIMSLFSGSGALRDAGGGGVVDMGRSAKARLTGYKGDSTEQFLPNPIKQNREAKRMVQREAKMQKYQAKTEAAKQRQYDKRNRSVSRAASGYAMAQVGRMKDTVTAPARNVADRINTSRENAAENIRAKTETVQASSPMSGTRKMDNPKDRMRVETRTEARTSSPSYVAAQTNARPQPVQSQPSQKTPAGEKAPSRPIEKAPNPPSKVREKTSTVKAENSGRSRSNSSPMTRRK